MDLVPTTKGLLGHPTTAGGVCSQPTYVCITGFTAQSRLTVGREARLAGLEPRFPSACSGVAASRDKASVVPGCAYFHALHHTARCEFLVRPVLRSDSVADLC